MIKTYLNSKKITAEQRMCQEMQMFCILERCSDTAGKAAKCYSRQVYSKSTSLINNHTDNCWSTAEVLVSSQNTEDTQVPEHSILHKLQTDNTLSNYQANIHTGNQHNFVEDASQICDTNFELYPGKTLITADEFSDDALEYLECSDVMTDLANEIKNFY
ncbi:unnamed protein product [Caretta caretta]